MLTGMPFSGMRRLSDIFNSHPDVVMRGEAEVPCLASAVPEFCNAADIGLYRGVAEDYLRRLAAAALREPSRRQLEAVSAGPWDEPERDPSDAPRRRLIIGSTSQLGHIQLLAAALPGVRVILTLRNPFGHVAAMLRAIARDGEAALPRAGALLATAQAKSYGLSDELYESMPVIDRLTWDWALRNEIAIDGLADVPEWRIVRRRELVVNPMMVAKALFSFADLPWPPQSCMEKPEFAPDTGDWLKGGDWPVRNACANGFADPFVQAFDAMTRPLYGTTSFYGQNVRRPHYDWEIELEAEDRQRILSLVRSTALSWFFPELEDWANLD